MRPVNASSFSSSAEDSKICVEDGVDGNASSRWDLLP